MGLKQRIAKKIVKEGAVGIASACTWKAAREKIKSLIKEGEARNIVVQSADGKRRVEFPVATGTAGVVAGLLILPTLTAIGVIVMGLSGWTIDVVKRDGTTETIHSDEE